jgi:hypothetical protein
MFSLDVMQELKAWCRGRAYLLTYYRSDTTAHIRAVQKQEQGEGIFGPGELLHFTEWK